MNIFGKRAVAGLATTLMIGGAVLGGSGIVDAQTTDSDGNVTYESVVDTASIASLVDSNRTDADLTIHKFIGDPDPNFRNQGNMGTTDTPIDAETLASADGIVFNVYKIDGLDVNNLDSWGEYSKLDTANIVWEGGTPVSIDGKTVTLADTAEVAGGNAKPSNGPLGLGFYLVIEQEHDSTAPVAAGQKALTKLDPFLVSLPGTAIDASGSALDEWNYDVHVFPKNQEYGVIKEVSDRHSVSGSVIDYKVTTDVPYSGTSLPDGESGLSYFGVFDKSPEHTTLNDGSFTAKLIDENGETQYEIPDTDILTRTAATEGGKEGTHIYLADTSLEEISKFSNEKSGYKVVFDYKATVGEIPVEEIVDGEPSKEVNEVYLYAEREGIVYTWNKDTPPDTPDVPNDTVESHYGYIQVNKVDGAGNAIVADVNNPEKDMTATFELYRCTDQDNLPTGGEGNSDHKNIELFSEALAVNGVTEFTTNAEGKLNISGIQLEDFYNGEAQDTKDEYDYCLVETKAPEGYALNPNPIPLELVTANAEAEIDVVNHEDDTIINLPRTGEAGMLGMVAAALLAIVAFAGSASGKRKVEA